MTISTSLSAAIETRLNTISGIGVVHDRPRFTANWSTFLDLFKSVIGGRSVIRGWMLSRESATPGEGEFGVTERVHNYTITGVAAFADSDALSQYDTMQALADSIMADLDSQTTLGVTGVEVCGVGPCALESYQELQFGSTLCHVFVLSVPIRVFLTTGTA